MDRKMNPGEIIDADRDPPPLAAKYLRDLLLGLDHLDEHLLVHIHAGRCKAAHIRPDILHLRRDDDLTRLFCVHGIKERILSPLPSQLPPDLPRNPFAAPEVRPVAVAQLYLKLITLEIIPLELPLDPLEVLFDFLRRKRGTHQGFKVFLFYANRRQFFCSSSTGAACPINWATTASVSALSGSCPDWRKRGPGYHGYPAPPSPSCPVRVPRRLPAHERRGESSPQA